MSSLEIGGLQKNIFTNALLNFCTSDQLNLIAVRLERLGQFHVFATKVVMQRFARNKASLFFAVDFNRKTDRVEIVIKSGPQGERDIHNYSSIVEWKY